MTPTTFGLYDKRLCQELESTLGDVIYNEFGRPLTSDELQKQLPGCDALIAGLDHVDSAALASADRLRVIARYGAGVDNVDLKAAAKKGITVTNTPNANSVSVAELAIGLLLSLARSIPEATRAVREGKWPRLQGKILAGKVIGLVGFGAIGKEVARRLQLWQSTVLACDPFGDKGLAHSLGVRLVDMEELIHNSDFLLLHVPLLDETRHMVDTDFLSRMKRGAYIVNAARGELIDQEALLTALDSGQLGGAALDVYAEEPPPPDSPLRRHPRLIATPHCGAHTDGAADSMGWQSVRDCLAVLRGEPPLHPVPIQGASA
ncbi:MAG: phosphoglycerate dehydrogenase [Acidobacteriaceae bacterium]